MKSAFLSVLCTALLAITSSYAAEITDSMSGAEIEKLLTDAGFGGRIITDRDTGAPVAMGTSGDLNFIVRAMDCGGEPIACRRLLFFANFDLNRPVNPGDFRVVNNFNEAHFDGRAYLIEGKNQIGVDYYIDLTGGVTSEHVSSRLSRWRGVMDSFLKQVSNNRTGA
ncbi:MAG: YbjN domain-containing protein [Aquisalinus sp.]|nr:YbjN domain-containing protein [Aquisalinus sp.]